MIIQEKLKQNDEKCSLTWSFKKKKNVPKDVVAYLMIVQGKWLNCELIEITIQQKRI